MMTRSADVSQQYSSRRTQNRTIGTLDKVLQEVPLRDRAVDAFSPGLVSERALDERIQPLSDMLCVLTIGVVKWLQQWPEVSDAGACRAGNLRRLEGLHEGPKGVAGGSALRPQARDPGDRPFARECVEGAAEEEFGGRV